MSTLEDLTDDERVQFMELLQESLWINTHLELFLWLQGRLQQHLPHDILIAAWGDFSIGLIYFDVISALPGVRTEKISNEKLTRLLKRLFNYWDNHGRTPMLHGMDDGLVLEEEIGCEVIDQNFNHMKSVLVHGIKDFRGRHDCLYVLLNTAQFTHPRTCTMLEALLPYIDTSLRKVPHLPEQFPNAELSSEPIEADSDSLSDTTPREAEIMELVRAGKTNIEIGMILDISAFTVKNHLQRIFKKLNVISRAQAVAKFEKRSAPTIGNGNPPERT